MNPRGRRRFSPIAISLAIATGDMVALVVSCGASNETKAINERAGGAGGEAARADGGGGSSTAMTSGGDGGAPIEGGTGGNNAQAGQSAGGAEAGSSGTNSGGDGGTSQACADTETDGASCPGGLCVAGSCVAPLVVDADADLGADAISPGRNCAEAPAFAVAGLALTQAQLAAAPNAGCLSPDDEVLLINLQGAPNATVNVGNWELLTVKSLSGASITFTHPPQRHYGAAADSDSDIGAGVGHQKVALIRVPHFGELTIPAGVTLTAPAWDGAIGGVLALRAASLKVDGKLAAGDIGYRAGRWSRDGGCIDSVLTEAGESITGPGAPSTLHNAGAPGGLGALTGVRFDSNSPINPSAGHALPGQAGFNGNGRTLGEPGAAYGSGDGSLLTMGSGSGGNLTCQANFVGPVLVDIPAPGAGIVLLLANTLTVGAGGSISATPTDSSRDVSCSGGTVLIRGGSFDLGSARVTALGSVARGNNATLGLSNQSSPGYVILDATGAITGTSDPAASIASAH
jgi:hypothetical protein